MAKILNLFDILRQILLSLQKLLPLFFGWEMALVVFAEDLIAVFGNEAIE